MPAPAGGKNERGTNIAITTATDQHINIWVPENPNAKVSVKKTEGVKIVESDSDRVDKNAAIKQAIGDKIRGELVKKALSKDAGKKKDEEKEAEKKKVEKAEANLKSAKAESERIKKMIEEGGKSSTNAAQTEAVGLTEAEIYEMADLYSQLQAEEWTDQDDFAELHGASSEDEHDTYAEAEADSASEEEGLTEDQILAQVDAEQNAPKPVVSLTPNVHVQVTRVGYE